MIKLFQFAPAFGLPNASPFCMKLETYLRMADLPFEIVAGVSSLGAPNRKVPYIDDGGMRLGDSTLIIEYLKSTYGDKLDAWLGADLQAVALAFQRLMEENLYWAIIYTRWFEAEGWARIQDTFFSKGSPWTRWIMPRLARAGLARELHGQGMGRHRPEEIHLIGRRDISALADFLGTKPYFMGDRPCSLDAVAYAFMANILRTPIESALKLHARHYPQLEAYCDRMRLEYYP